MTAASRTGLLLAMMEPPPAMEEEFQDWYDTEHFPERATCEGFVTAQRLVCLQGFPRYLALYDLSDLSVMDGPGYAAIARNRYSRWTQRIIPRMWGHYRFEANQIYPGRRASRRAGPSGASRALAVPRRATGGGRRSRLGRACELRRDGRCAAGARVQGARRRQLRLHRDGGTRRAGGRAVARRRRHSAKHCATWM